MTPRVDAGIATVDLAQLDTLARRAPTDPGVLPVLFEVCKPSLLKRIGYDLPSSEAHQTEDVLQVALTGVAAKITTASFPGFIPFRAWLREFVVNASRDWVKYNLRLKRDARRNVVLPAGSGSDPLNGVPDGRGELPDRVARRHEREQLLVAALDELGERLSKIVKLRYLDGFDVAETAVLVGLSQGRVKNLCSRAMRLLREKLGPRDDILS